MAKPRSMLARTYADPVTAVGWLRGEVRQHAPLIRPEDSSRLYRLLGYLDHRDTVEPERQHACRYGQCDVLCYIDRHNRVVHWQHALTSGLGVAWAIIPNRAVNLGGTAEDTTAWRR